MCIEISNIVAKCGVHAVVISPVAVFSRFMSIVRSAECTANLFDQFSVNEAPDEIMIDHPQWGAKYMCIRKILYVALYIE